MKIPTRLLQTEWPPNDGLKPGDARFDDLFQSVKDEGIKKPLTINLKWRVIDGNHRLAAARLLNIKEVEVQVWTGVEMIL
jgi:ParB-like chromosome segregation protein Spo0J